MQTSNVLERSLVIWDHTVLPGRGDSPNFTLAFTSTHFTVARKVEGWVDLGTAVRVHSLCPRLYIALVVMINTRSWWASLLGPNTPHSSVLTTRPLRPAKSEDYLRQYVSLVNHNIAFTVWHCWLRLQELSDELLCWVVLGLQKINLISVVNVPCDIDLAKSRSCLALRWHPALVKCVRVFHMTSIMSLSIFTVSWSITLTFSQSITSFYLPTTWDLRSKHC